LVSTVTTAQSIAGASLLLTPDRNASANWSSAGMLSVGGIPTRTQVCATVNPLGAARDYTTNIQNAIAACPLGEAVMLGAGTFTIAEGNYVLLNKGITLRGAGPGVTILQRDQGAP
jgi:polygalacturonase